MTKQHFCKTVLTWPLYHQATAAAANKRCDIGASNVPYFLAMFMSCNREGCDLCLRNHSKDFVPAPERLSETELTVHQISVGIKIYRDRQKGVAVG